MSTEKKNERGVQIGDSPYLMPETNPNPFTDTHTPSEKFVPLPEIDTDEEPRSKRIIKYIAIGLLLIFVVITFIAIWNAVPQTLFEGDTGKGHFFS